MDDKADREFSTFQISKLLGMPRSTIQLHIKQNHISPSIRKANKRGTKNRFSVDDLMRIRVFQMLSGIGLRQEKAKDECNKLNFDLVDQANQWAYMVLDGDDSKIITNQTNDGMMKMGVLYNTMCLTLNLYRIKNEILNLI